jgi:hypothetical protein
MYYKALIITIHTYILEHQLEDHMLLHLFVLGGPLAFDLGGLGSECLQLARLDCLSASISALFLVDDLGH